MVEVGRLHRLCSLDFGTIYFICLEKTVGDPTSLWHCFSIAYK